MNYFLMKWDVSKECDDDEVVLAGTLEACKAAVPGLKRQLGGGFAQMLEPGIGGPNRWENNKWAIYILDEQGNSPEN